MAQNLFKEMTLFKQISYVLYSIIAIPISFIAGAFGRLSGAIYSDKNINSDMSEKNLFWKIVTISVIPFFWTSTILALIFGILLMTVKCIFGVKND
jgi:ABC-type transporter Mla maintaining outer membrane lipid asymmetry permease subunit MlaE